VVAKGYGVSEVIVISDELKDRNTHLKRAQKREMETMSKQSTRQLTRQERRREEQRRREEERRRDAWTKRITTISIIAASVLAVAALIYFVVVQGQSPANAAYPPTDSISCDGLEQTASHYHAHVTIYIDGNRASIPATIGIAPPTDNPSCFYWLHTHTSDGVIHIEAPSGRSFTLGNFFDIWGKRFSQLDYPGQLDQSDGWQAFVNGKPFKGVFRTIPLQSHTLITLAFNSPGVQPDTSFNWNGL